jgi:hypothetical protein
MSPGKPVRTSLLFSSPLADEKVFADSISASVIQLLTDPLYSQLVEVAGNQLFLCIRWQSLRIDQSHLTNSR